MGIEFRTSGITASALNLLAFSPAPCLSFLRYFTHCAVVSVFYIMVQYNMIAIILPSGLQSPEKQELCYKHKYLEGLRSIIHIPWLATSLAETDHHKAYSMAFLFADLFIDFFIFLS